MAQVGESKAGTMGPAGTAPGPLRAIGRIAVPGPLRRLDHWLRLNRPLIWRTRVHWFLWYSLILGNLVLFALGWAYPVRQTAVPTIAGMTWLLGGLWVISALILGLWALGQYRRPLPEVGPRVWVLTLGLYWVCMSCVLLNPLSFALPIVPRIAAVTPDREFAQEYAFHAQYGFWVCHEAVTKDAFERHGGLILGALRKYGLSDQVSIRASEIRYCERPLPFLYTEGFFGREIPIGLGEVQESIAAAKASVRALGTYYERFLQSVAGALIFGALLAALLGVGVSSPALRSRWFTIANWHRSPGRAYFPKLRFVTDLDRRIRTTTPMLWSAGVHESALLVALYGTVIVAGWIGLQVIAARVMDSPGSFFGIDIGRDLTVTLRFSWLILLSCVLPIPGALWMSRRPPCERTVIRNQTTLLVNLIFAASVVAMVSFAILPILSNPEDERAAFGSVGISAAFSLAGYGLLARCISLPRLFIAATLVLLFLVALIFAHDTFQMSDRSLMLVAVAIWALTWLSTAGLALNPRTYSVAPVIATINLTFSGFGIPLVWIISQDRNVTLPSLFLSAFAIVIPLYLLAAIPAIRVLIKYRYYPRP